MEAFFGLFALLGLLLLARSLLKLLWRAARGIVRWLRAEIPAARTSAPPPGVEAAWNRFGRQARARFRASADGRRYCSESAADGGSCMLMPGHFGLHVTREGVRFEGPADDTVCRARTGYGLRACVLEPGHGGQHVTRGGFSFDDDGAYDAERRQQQGAAGPEYDGLLR